MKLQDFASDYLARCQKAGRRDMGVRRSRLRGFVWALGGNEVEMIRFQDIEKWLEILTDKYSKKPLKPATFNSYISYLHHLFADAVKRDMRLDNPVDGIGRKPVVTQREVFLTTQEQDALVEACEPWLRPLVLFLLQTGMRLGETVNLRWQDVDFAQGAVFVRDSKTHRSRWVPLTEEAKNILSILSDFQLGNQFKPRNPFIFFGPDGQPLVKAAFPANSSKLPYRYGLLEAAFQRAVSKMDLTDFYARGNTRLTIYGLRHTNATMLAQAGVSADDRAKIHGNSAKMQERYTHQTLEHLKGQISKLESYGSR